MPFDVKIPELGESITEVTLTTWHKSTGDWVEKDEGMFEIDSDKITTDVPAEESGIITVIAEEGAELEVGAVVAKIDTSAQRPKAVAVAATEEASQEVTSVSASTIATNGTANSDVRATSVAKKIAADQGVNLSLVQGTGPAGRITKTDVLNATNTQPELKTQPKMPQPQKAVSVVEGERGSRREKMSKLRQRIAERLVYAKNTTAMLTTFNEVDMTEVMALRAKFKEQFKEKYGVSLGFMSFFVKACVSALQEFPRINAYIVGDEIEFHDFVDISVAVGTEKGLVVPILRNAEQLGFAEVELGVKELALKARDGKLTMDDMTGGTFTISNGGVYGSLNSTPILNPPQSAILGMHKIMSRAMEDPDNPGQIALRPMMYIAMSYDHRIVDGAEAVGFLVHLKECIEDPDRLMLGV